ncbi:hypothetical protein BASA81_010046 [Batrachochytrium salamandrivorans]|nr:hypothetical protein BASA81_010046 [Batrachochytrium salamandrivorans]
MFCCSSHKSQTAQPTAQPDTLPVADAPVAATPAPVVSKSNMDKLAEELGKLDQSGGKTAGLNHVTKDMKSANNSAPVVAPKAPAPKQEEAPKGKQVFACQGNKWQVEGQTGTVTIPADQVSVKHTVYVYNCIGATVIVEGKCNTITVDSCKKTQVVFSDVLAMCETVNSKQIKIQCKGRAPTVSVDKTDGFTVYLSREAMFETKVVAAKSSEMNLQVPGKTDEDAWVEKVIPEQFVYHLTPEYTIKSEVSELYSAGG